LCRFIAFIFSPETWKSRSSARRVYRLCGLITSCFLLKHGKADVQLEECSGCAGSLLSYFLLKHGKADVQPEECSYVHSLLSHFLLKYSGIKTAALMKQKVSLAHMNGAFHTENTCECATPQEHKQVGRGSPQAGCGRITYSLNKRKHSPVAEQAHPLAVTLPYLCPSELSFKLFTFYFTCFKACERTLYM
jgi:hypothetical protein